MKFGIGSVVIDSQNPVAKCFFVRSQSVNGRLDEKVICFFDFDFVIREKVGEGRFVVEGDFKEDRFRHVVFSSFNKFNIIESGVTVNRFF